MAADEAHLRVDGEMDEDVPEVILKEIARDDSCSLMLFTFDSTCRKSRVQPDFFDFC